MAKDLHAMVAESHINRQPQNLPSWTGDLDSTLLAEELRADVLLSSAKSIFVGSDYGGEHQTAKYAVYGFLIVDHSAMGNCAVQQGLVREKYFSGSPRTMEYKKLYEKDRLNALPEWLLAADSMRGYLITVVVRVKLDSLFAEPSRIKELPRILADAGLGAWKPLIAEKIFRILHLQSYLSSRLLRPSQEMIWMMDRDSIAENKEKLELLSRAWMKIFPLYASRGATPYSLGLMLPFEGKEPSDLIFNDRLSYPDLVAGAVGQVFTDRLNREGGENTEEKSKDRIIFQWFANDSQTLKKKCLLVEPYITADGRVGFQNSYFKLSPPRS